MKNYKVIKNFFLDGEIKLIGEDVELSTEQYNDCRNKVVEVVKRKIVIHNPIKKEPKAKEIKTSKARKTSK